MNLNFSHIGFSFSLIWNLIKGNDTQKSRVITAFLWLILLLGMLYVLLLWHSVPTYTHYIYLDRLYSEKPSLSYILNEHKQDYFVSADYKLNLSSGASAFQNKKTLNFYEEVKFIHELSFPMYEHSFKNKKSWSSMFIKSDSIKDFKDVLSPKLAEEARMECEKNKLSFTDFKYGYFFLHRYQDDISRYNISEDIIRTVNSETDSINEYLDVSKHFERKYRGKIIDDNQFVKDKYLPHFPNTHFKGEALFVTLSNGGGISGCVSRMEHKNQNAFNNFWWSLFRMYDLTKARYDIYLKSNAIDSIKYTIIFDEGVSFSDINVNPDYKDMNTLVYKVADFDREEELSKGIKFFVEFLESSNIQYIRSLFLGGVCCVPILKIFGKIRSIITEPNRNNPSPTVPESRPVALRNRVQKRKKFKKKK